MIAMDLDWLHASLQYPTAVTEATVGIILVAKYWRARSREIIYDPMTTLLIGLMIVAISVKQLWWNIWGGLRAMDQFESAARLALNIIPPMALNVVICSVGLLAIHRIANTTWNCRESRAVVWLAVALLVASQVILGAVRGSY